MKSEPGAYSIDDMESDGKTHWDSIRSFEARNFMQEMKVGDKIVFYHSNAKPPGPAGVVKVCKTAYPDFTAWDSKHKYFDPKTDKDNPTWYMVDVEFVEKFDDTVPLADIRANPALEDMMLVNRFRAPSVMPIEKRHFDEIRRMAKS